MGCHFLLQGIQLFATPWTVAYQAPPSVGFSRQEYWSGLPFPSPGDLPDLGIEPGSPAFQVDTLTSEPPGKPKRRGQQKMRWLDGITTQWTWVWVNYGSWWWTGRPGLLQSMVCKQSDTTEWLNWTEGTILAYLRIKKKTNRRSHMLQLRPSTAK